MKERLQLIQSYLPEKGQPSMILSKGMQGVILRDDPTSFLKIDDVSPTVKLILATDKGKYVYGLYDQSASLLKSSKGKTLEQQLTSGSTGYAVFYLTPLPADNSIYYELSDKIKNASNIPTKLRDLILKIKQEMTRIKAGHNSNLKTGWYLVDSKWKMKTDAITLKDAKNKVRTVAYTTGAAGSLVQSRTYEQILSGNNKNEVVVTLRKSNSDIQAIKFNRADKNKGWAIYSIDRKTKSWTPTGKTLKNDGSIE